jgi:Ca2+-transporting ATPase
MRRPPRPPKEAVLDFGRGLRIVVHGLLLAAAAIVGFLIVHQDRDENLEQARTVVFCVLAFSQLFFAFACRSHRYTLPQLGVFSNPFLFLAVALSSMLQFAIVMLPFTQPIFEVAPPQPWHWPLVLGLALAPVTVIEVVKLVRAARQSAIGHRLSADSR